MESFDHLKEILNAVCKENLFLHFKLFLIIYLGIKQIEENKGQ